MDPNAPSPAPTVHTPDTNPGHRLDPSWSSLAEPPPSLGLAEVALPLWSRRWRLLLSALLLGALMFGTSLVRPLSFVSQATFVVVPVQRPSGASGLGNLPALSLIAAGPASPIDQYAAILRSRSLADRLIERFDLVRAWQLPDARAARIQLSRRLEITVARREGIVAVVASDNHPQRAAALANQAVEELKQLLRGLSLDEAQQRRGFYEEQLSQARRTLEGAQQRLRASGFDSASLRTEPGAAAAAYARLQAEITSAEIRLAALRRVRANASPEVMIAQAEIEAMRSKLARLEAPRDEGGGAFSGRLRELRYAEQLVDTLTRQLDAARVDAEAAQVPIQWLDRAQPDHVPASPNPVLWALTGTVLGFVLQAAWVLIRHSAALARTDERRQLRLQQIIAVLPARSRGTSPSVLKRFVLGAARRIAQIKPSKPAG
jgi:capsule polysaccharide export protein KpsE/RkpR